MLVCHLAIVKLNPISLKKSVKMIKICALNDETKDESGSEEEITKEALEQIALQEYLKALELQRKGNITDAINLLKKLLNTELLYDIKKPTICEKVTKPLLNLKYLCYKNLAGMLTTINEIDAAIELFCEASKLDNSDITLWHRLGQLCMLSNKYEMALSAFQHGVDINPRHWPCLDKVVTLLFGLNHYEECIITIYEALELDPGYLRGLVYRRHLFTVYKSLRDYMEYLNPVYKYNENDDEPIEEEKSNMFFKEAQEINEIFIKQQKSLQFKYSLPDLILKKPITSFTWQSVGESLVHMHNFMTENQFSHACRIELIFDKKEVIEELEEPVKSESVENKIESKENSDLDNKMDVVSLNENNDLSDKDKPTTDTEKVESDLDVVSSDNFVEVLCDNKPTKKSIRRRGRDLSFLQQWVWCTNRRSGRKKPVNKQDNYTIYDNLRQLVPIALSQDAVNKEKCKRDTSPDVSDIANLFEVNDEIVKINDENYFGTNLENTDVENYFKKYKESKRDIIDLLKEFLIFLSDKWTYTWPNNLKKTYKEAYKCYSCHIEMPSLDADNSNSEDLLDYLLINLLKEEFSINKKLSEPMEKNVTHCINVIQEVGITLRLQPYIFKSSNCLETTLRYLWCKFHIHMLNKSNDFALDCLYQLLYEFENIGENHDDYELNILSFTFKPTIKKTEILHYITFMERNIKLSTVLNLFENSKFDEVITIIEDSFEYCKSIENSQNEEICLDFAVQLSLILDSYWALHQVDNCLKWSFICLHEALKHYFRLTTSSSDYEKWSNAVVKILFCMEHTLTTEGLSCLEAVSDKHLSQGIEDLIRVIGHQVETNSNEMPLDTILPWIILHFILQREEDQGRAKQNTETDDIPNAIMVLFIAHDQLGQRGWCCKSEAKLLYFILDIVVPRLRSPLLSKPLEYVCSHMEQVVYCLYGHPNKKNKIKYILDHNATPKLLSWERAQQVYEIFKPQILPALKGKVPIFPADTEQLFKRILDLLPPECNPLKYIPDIEKYIKGVETKLPNVPLLLPYKMKDIYFLIGDYHFKKEEVKKAIEYNMLDIVINNNRVESWAEISLSKAANLGRLLNSCKNLNSEKEFLNPAKSVIRCYKQALQIDPSHCTIMIEYGNFVYTVHSFCSRVLKQASESLSMEDFEALEKQKDDMLATTQKCFTAVIGHIDSSHNSEEDSWLNYYMLGKVAEKRNKPPAVYLEYYMNAVKSLIEAEATYPSRINYSTPTHLCFEVLELHYRIHASILKYIEQHENKPIPSSVGKTFTTCIQNWNKSPFTKKTKKEVTTDNETENKQNDIQAANILKRSISDAGEEDNQEVKKQKLEAAAAKVKRSVSYDVERSTLNGDENSAVDDTKEAEILNKEKKADKLIDTEEVTVEKISDLNNVETVQKNQDIEVINSLKNVDTKKTNDLEISEIEKNNQADKKEVSSTPSSSSSSETSSSDSSSSSSTESSRDSDSSTSSQENRSLTDDEISIIVNASLDALEDCSSRLCQNYKAIYRVAHYHFYYKKGKDIERCRDLMLSTFNSRSGQKLGGLFSVRKNTNFFNNIWKIPSDEIDRPGGFAFHMNRCVLLTLEILKEIDDHLTLLDLSMQLHRIPELDKTYLRNSDRMELAQQAFSLCVQSLRGQLFKFSQQEDLKSNEVEQQAFKSLMLDIYNAYQKSQKQPNSKQLISLLGEGYKMIANVPITENTNLIDLSMKYCQLLKQQLKLDKSQNLHSKKQTVKSSLATESIKNVTVSSALAKPDKLPINTATTGSSINTSSAAKITSNDLTTLHSYLPMLNDRMFTQQTAAALTLQYLNSMNALAGYSSLQNNLSSSLQNSLQNTFQEEYYRKFIGSNIDFGSAPVKKLKRGPKSSNRQIPSAVPVIPLKSLKSTPILTSKSTPTSVITTMQKPSMSKAPSMGTVLPNLPTSLKSLSNSTTSKTTTIKPKTDHITTSFKTIQCKPTTSSQQVSPGKTLQEKLAERQKNLPVSISKSSQDVNASLGRLPSSLTITKTGSHKQISIEHNKKTVPKRSLAFNERRPNVINTDEIIVLDDDD